MGYACGQVNLLVWPGMLVWPRVCVAHLLLGRPQRISPRLLLPCRLLVRGRFCKPLDGESTSRGGVKEVRQKVVVTAWKAVATARHCMLTAARRAARASRNTDCALASSPVTDDRTVRREAKRRNVGREVA